MGYPFIQSHFELIVWPLSLLLLVFRSPFVILAVQDVSLVGTGALVVLWVAELVERRQLDRRAAGSILAVTTLMVLVDPLVYYTATLDFHIEATATFFAVFAAYDIWSGRHRRAVVWLTLCLLCGDLGGLYVVGVGLSATLASRTTRKLGLWTIVAGMAWVAVISVLGANKGSGISAQFALRGRRTAVPGRSQWTRRRGPRRVRASDPGHRPALEPEDGDRQLSPPWRSDRHPDAMGLRRAPAGAADIRGGFQHALPG